MMTIFTFALAGVTFAGMVLCMGMFLKNVVSTIPHVADINHRVCLTK